MGLASRLLARVRELDLFYHLHRPVVPGSWDPQSKLFTFDDLRLRLPEADVIVCATDSPHHVVLKEHASFMGSGRPVLILDLSTPRNVDPALQALAPSLKIVDLDDLKHWYRREAADLDTILRLGSRTVREHADLYQKLVAGFAGGGGAPQPSL